MKRLRRLLGAIGAGAIVTSSSLVYAQSGLNCQTCRIVEECYDVLYPCGTNEDGTVMMCMRVECEPVERCLPAPCPAEPNPEDPGFPEGPDFPDLPDIPDFPPSPF